VRLTLIPPAVENLRGQRDLLAQRAAVVDRALAVDGGAVLDWRRR
jgi:hypothetical protein